MAVPHRCSIPPRSPVEVARRTTSSSRARGRTGDLRSEACPHPIRIANISGMFGDRPTAAREMLEGGPVDVLTGDWLAELTMLILARMRARRPDGAYGRTFVTQMEDVDGHRRGAGSEGGHQCGWSRSPSAAPERLRRSPTDWVSSPRIAAITGDDLMGRIPDLIGAGHAFEHLDTGEPLGKRASKLVTANAYLGWVGDRRRARSGRRHRDHRPHHRRRACWWDRRHLASPVGSARSGTGWPVRWRPATSSNAGVRPPGATTRSSTELDDPVNLAFPWAEIAEDGSSVIGKHDGTGGEVSVGHRGQPAALRDRRSPVSQPRRDDPFRHNRRRGDRP